MSHFVYHCYDADDVVLYVGCTGNPKQRELGHRNASPWWSDVAPSWKLTSDQVADVRRRMSRFENPRDIARLHGITRSMVFRVMKRTVAS